MLGCDPRHSDPRTHLSKFHNMSAKQTCGEYNLTCFWIDRSFKWILARRPALKELLRLCFFTLTIHLHFPSHKQILKSKIRFSSRGYAKSWPSSTLKYRKCILKGSESKHFLSSGFISVFWYEHYKGEGKAHCTWETSKNSIFQKMQQNPLLLIPCVEFRY